MAWLPWLSSRAHLSQRFRKKQVSPKMILLEKESVLNFYVEATILRVNMINHKTIVNKNRCAKKTKNSYGSTSTKPTSIAVHIKLFLLHFKTSIWRDFFIFYEMSNSYHFDKDTKGRKISLLLLWTKKR